MPDEILTLDPSDQKQVQTAVSLHTNLLPESSIPRLGLEFMEEFYYTRLVHEGLIACHLYRRGETFVAFAAHTRYPYTFMSRGARRYFWPLCLLTLRALLSCPERAFILLETRRLMKRRGRLADNGRTAELLSFGVQPEFTAWRDSVTGKRVSNLLFEDTMRRYKQEGFLNLQFIVRKENKRSLLFFKSYGAALVKADYLPGDVYLLKMRLQE